MWKIGDKIKCIGYWEDTLKDDFTINRYYTIIECDSQGGNKYGDKENYRYKVVNDNFDNWWIIPKCFIKKEITNEIDWLNAIQENFKEGV